MKQQKIKQMIEWLEDYDNPVFESDMRTMMTVKQIRAMIRYLKE